MILRHYPAGPLSRHVACFWWSRRHTVQEHCEHILPSGGVQLIFALHDSPISCASGTQRTVWTRSVVHGPQHRYYVAGPKPPGTSVGVAFRAGAAGTILGVELPDIADRHPTLEMLWGRPAADLHTQLSAAAGAMQCFRILEQELTRRLHPSHVMHPAVAWALQSLHDRGAGRVGHLQGACGYSPKHFIGLFKATVGLTPKQYGRIQRFNTVVRGLAGSTPGTLADLAAAAGYADQAHMTREFREFAGVTPTGYQPTGPDRHLHHRT